MVDLSEVEPGRKVVRKLDAVVRHVDLLEPGQLWLLRALSDALLDTLPQTLLKHVVRSFEAHLRAENGGISTPQASNVTCRPVHAVLHVAANAQTHGCRREHFVEDLTFAEFNLDALVQRPGLFEHGRFRLVETDSRNRNLLLAHIFLFTPALTDNRVLLVGCR